MTESSLEPLGVEPLGVEICRLSLDLGRGRIRHPRQVGIAIRAGLFADLALDGHVFGQKTPETQGDGDTGHKLTDAVHRAVAGRRSTGWGHWFNHIDADRKACVAYLVDSGIWSRDGRRLIDNTDGRTLEDQQRIQLAGRPEADVPGDVRDAILVLLLLAAGAQGRPMPRRAGKLARVWLPPLLTPLGEPGRTTWSMMVAALRQIHRSVPLRLISG